MGQQTLAGFEKYGKTTRRAQFLAEMEQVAPSPPHSSAVTPKFMVPNESGETRRPERPSSR
jgi:hypothetical protein